ncbi:hypothetical protein ACHAQH_002859, partial [Verticillium albo-atrum]
MCAVPWQSWAGLAFCIITARVLARIFTPADQEDRENLLPVRFHERIHGVPNIRDWRIEKPAPEPTDFESSEGDSEPISILEDEPDDEVVDQPRHDENRSETPEDAAEVRAYLRA